MEYKSIKEEKFDSIYQAHVDSILKVAMHYANDYDIAQEITQKTFIQLYIHLDNMDMDYIFPWLVRTAKNFLYNSNRNSKREILGEVIDTIMEYDYALCCTESMDERYIREEQRQRIGELNDSIFEKLYKKNRKWYEALTLVYCLEKPQQEVAEELGIAIDTLQSRLYRAKQWIRKNYAKEYENVMSWF